MGRKSVAFKKVADRKALVGRHIYWRMETALDYPYLDTLKGPALVTETVGRNLAVDTFGTTDWLYTPNIEIILVEDDTEKGP